MRLNMLKLKLAGTANCALLALSCPAFAGSLQVSPILIEIGQGITTTTENLENKGTTVITAQVRVFKWTQVDGKDNLTPTTDVIASPPALKIQPGAKATVRIVRLTKEPLKGEEAYRLIVDDIPPPPDKPGDSVTFAVRHAIPVFFQAPGIKTMLGWSATMKGDQLEVTAKNAGDLHSRLAQMTVKQGSTLVGALNGLAGYALGHDATHWLFKTKGISPGTSLELKATSNDGPISTNITVN